AARAGLPRVPRSPPRRHRAAGTRARRDRARARARGRRANRSGAPRARLRACHRRSPRLSPRQPERGAHTPPSRVNLPRSAGASLIVVYLLAPFVLLPRTLEDLDSINFALGVRQFDVARHQPHPPGYPVFIAMSKASTSVLRTVGFDAAAPRGLAIWS